MQLIFLENVTFIFSSTFIHHSSFLVIESCRHRHLWWQCYKSELKATNLGYTPCFHNNTYEEMAAKRCPSGILFELFFENLEKWPQNQIPSKLYTFYKLYRLEKFSRDTLFQLIHQTFLPGYWRVSDTRPTLSKFRASKSIERRILSLARKRRATNFTAPFFLFGRVGKIKGNIARDKKKNIFLQSLDSGEWGKKVLWYLPTVLLVWKLRFFRISSLIIEGLLGSIILFLYCT